MNRDTLLLTVEDHFLIEGRGLIVVPHLDIPPAPRRFVPFCDDVRVQRPDGTEQSFSIRFLIEHVSLRGGGSKWNIVPMFAQGTKETIPIGSCIYVCAEMMMKLNGDAPSDRDNSRMSPELEMLDQLLGGDLPVTVARFLFDDDQRFVHAALAMLNASEIRLLDGDGNGIPKWKWSEILKSHSGNERVQITDGGIKRIA